MRRPAAIPLLDEEWDDAVLPVIRSNRAGDPYLDDECDGVLGESGQFADVTPQAWKPRPVRPDDNPFEVMAPTRLHFLRGYDRVFVRYEFAPGDWAIARYDLTLASGVRKLIADTERHTKFTAAGNPSELYDLEIPQ